MINLEHPFAVIPGLGCRAIAEASESIVALLLRQPDLNIDEDERALSDSVWRWHGSVGMHVDDVGRNQLAVGMIIRQTGTHWLVAEGRKTQPLVVGSVYILDPHVSHGVLAHNRSADLIAYIEWENRETVSEFTAEGFVTRAIEHIKQLVASPQPNNEIWD